MKKGTFKEALSKLLSLLLFILLMSPLVHAGKTKKAYKALEEYNYFKAKKLFEKRQKKDVVAASYGLSVIYARGDNPFYNLDSAYKFIYQASAQYPKMKKRKRKAIDKLEIDSLQIEQWKDTIDYYRYKVLLLKEDLETYEEYIELHPQSKWRRKAIASRDSIAFAQAKEENSVSSYENFITNYPLASQNIEARSLYEKRLFESITKSGSLASYEFFVKEYPKSSYQGEAQDSIYIISTVQKNIESYHNFILKHPENRNVEQAWRNIYKLFMHEYSTQRISEFKIAYPNYPFIEDLETNLELVNKEYLPFSINKGWGFMDTSGVVMLEPIYESVEPFVNGFALVVRDGKIGYIDKAGKVVIPFEYIDGEAFQEGLAIVEKDDYFGVINQANQVIVPFSYELVGVFNSGLAVVANDTAYGYVNKHGVEAIPIVYDYASDFNEGFALVEKGGKRGIINTRGEEVVAIQNEWLEPFNKYGLSRIKKDSLVGLVDKSGEIVLPMIYDAIGDFSNGLALIVKGKKYGYINTKGEVKIPIEFDYNASILVLGEFDNGYAKYALKQQFGVIDTNGKKMFPAMFENIDTYTNDNWVAVKKRGKWGYSNQQLQLKLPYTYNYATTFVGDYARVEVEGLWGMIDKSGSLVIPNVYSEITYITDWGYALKIGKQIRILTKDLEECTNLRFHKVEEYDEYYIYLQDEIGDSYYLDKRTNKIIKPKL